MTDRKRGFCRFVSVLTLLLAVVPAVTRADSGPKNEVQAVRGAERARAHCYAPATQCSITVTDVVVVQPYALLTWRNVHSGGEALWRKRTGSSWVRVTGGGGSMNVRDLEHYGVPAQTAQQLLKRQNHV
jgi:hypothetical protein